VSLPLYAEFARRVRVPGTRPASSVPGSEGPACCPADCQTIPMPGGPERGGRALLLLDGSYLTAPQTIGTFLVGS
jgi:hypothetical protein